MTGVKAYMTGKIKVRGDLILAQKLEDIFEKAGGRDVSLNWDLKLIVWITDCLSTCSVPLHSSSKTNS